MRHTALQLYNPGVVLLWSMAIHHRGVVVNRSLPTNQCGGLLIRPMAIGGMMVMLIHRT